MEHSRNFVRNNSLNENNDNIDLTAICTIENHAEITNLAFDVFEVEVYVPSDIFFF